jgi:hypothetical protein
MKAGPPLLLPTPRMGLSDLSGSNSPPKRSSVPRGSNRHQMCFIFVSAWVASTLWSYEHSTWQAPMPIVTHLITATRLDQPAASAQPMKDV